MTREERIEKLRRMAELYREKGLTVQARRAEARLAELDSEES